jgi:hypothetical protein
VNKFLEGEAMQRFVIAILAITLSITASANSPSARNKSIQPAPQITTRYEQKSTIKTPNPISSVGIIQANKESATIPVEKKSDSNEKTSNRWWADPIWIGSIFTALIFLVGVGQAVLFFFQLRIMRAGIRDATLAATSASNNAIATKEIARTSEQQLIRGERAFVHADDITWDRRPTNLQGTEFVYRFYFCWINNGNTPTKNMITHVNFYLSNIDIPPNFDFREPNAPTASGRVPPKSRMSAPPVPAAGITPQDLMDVHLGRKFFYIYGWTKYNDVFDGTPQHVTRICFKVIVNGDPANPGPDVRNVDFLYPFHNRNNCSDEECDIEPR